MRLAVHSKIIASALAITAVGAPAASAHFDLEPGATAHGAGTAVTRVVAPNPDQQFMQATFMPPALRPAAGSEHAIISHAEAQRHAALSYSPTAGARYSSADVGAYAATVHPVAVTGPVVKAPGDGFDYGDAAIGAGITGAIVLLAGAGTVAVRRRSQPQHS